MLLAPYSRQARHPDWRGRGVCRDISVFIQTLLSSLRFWKWLISLLSTLNPPDKNLSWLQERALKAWLSVRVNEPLVSSVCSLTVMLPVFDLSCCKQPLRDNWATQRTSIIRKLKTRFTCKKVLTVIQLWWALHKVAECVCICKCEYSGCYFLVSVRHESSGIFMPLISLHTCTKLSPPDHGRKTPTTTNKTKQKKTLSAIGCICWNPQRKEKWAGWRKKITAYSLPPILPGAWGSPGSAWVSPTTELCLDRNQCTAHQIGIQ